MSINDFHASLSNDDNSDLETLRSLRSADVSQIEDDLDGWIPWG